MNNEEVCKYINDNVKPHINSENKEYVADQLIKEGYGQSCGGYFKSIDKTKIVPEKAEPSQKFHFLSYYNKDEKKKKNPTYNRLICPQLLLWIAEIAGLSYDRLQKAKNIVINFENKNSLKDKNKKGSYLDINTRKEIKEVLKIDCINKIIKNSSNWDEVLSEVKKL